MAFKSQSGKRYDNPEIGRAADRSMSKPAAMPQAEQGGMEHEEQPIEESVQQHGPADHIEMHTHHQDGHVHKSKHHEKHSAHHHVDAAFPQEEQQGEEMGGGKGFEAVPPMQ